ncbi:MAG: hypothetical protein R3257_05795, partial [bacterium]|nr:hypothetical protein [bacterium]
WGAWRIKKLKKLFKKLLVFFPFEEQFYKNHHLLNVEWVGHPLQEWIGNSPFDWDAEIGESTQGLEFIGILPGSRFGTIRQHLPPMLEAAPILHEKNPKRRILIPLAPSIPKEWISKQLGETGSFVKVLARESHRVLRVCRSAMIGQGTATLEAAFCETPMVLCGKYTAATAVMARLLKVRPQGILHRLAHRSISPELWQREVNGIHIARAIESILDNEEKYQQDVRELKKIKEIFAAKARPSLNAANAIQNILDGSHDIKILA